MTPSCGSGPSCHACFLCKQVRRDAMIQLCDETHFIHTINKKRPPCGDLFLWEYTGSNRGPSACKADALNQLSYTPNIFISMYLSNRGPSRPHLLRTKRGGGML